MDAASTDVYVLFLLLAPLSAVLVTLIGKLLPREVSPLPAFLIWFSGSLWSLLRTTDTAGSSPRMYAFGGWREPLGIVFELNGIGWAAAVLALWHFYAYLPFSPVKQLPIWLGIGGALVGSIAAVMQNDAKRILAYSSVGQIGFIVAVFSFEGALGKTAALFYILLHALSKALLFLSVGSVTHHAGSRDVYSLRGMQRRFPLTAVWYWIAAFTLMGIPLSGGYYAKLLVSSTLYSYPGAWLLNIAGAATAIALFKLGRIFTGPWTGTDKKTSAIGSASLGMAILAAACVAIALFPQHLFRFLTSLSVIGPGGVGARSTGLVIESSVWYSTGSLLKAALITISGIAGLLVFRFQGVSKGLQTKGITTFASISRVGLNSSLRFMVAGLLLLLFLSLL